MGDANIRTTQQQAGASWSSAATHSQMGGDREECMIHRGENRGQGNTGMHRHTQGNTGKPASETCAQIPTDTDTDTETRPRKRSHTDTLPHRNAHAHASHTGNTGKSSHADAATFTHTDDHTETTRETLSHAHREAHSHTPSPAPSPLSASHTETRGARRLRSAATHRTSGAGTGRHRSTGKTGETPHTGEHTRGNTQRETPTTSLSKYV